MGWQGLHRAAARARGGVWGAGRRHERGDWGRSWSVGAIALVIGMGVVLGGCSTPAPEVEKTPPVVSQAPSPTPTPTPTPTGPVKPERPADMDRTDEVGAAAAATYFLELYPYVMATGDFVEWDAMTWADLCTFCTSSKERQIQRAAAAETYEGGEVSVAVVSTYPLDSLIGGYPLDVQMEQREAVIRDSDGTEKDRQSGFSGQLRVEMLNDGTNWRVLTVGTEE
ncbi:DUF6318 family protein [Oerskovia sp. NPDC060338]|uniref:DUF6318 family protein n=1 Tax=Oerskovia sp. NPDC060338 TaxID=3347100 RepID=UPI00364656E2